MAVLPVSVSSQLLSLDEQKHTLKLQLNLFHKALTSDSPLEGSQNQAKDIYLGSGLSTTESSRPCQPSTVHFHDPSGSFRYVSMVRPSALTSSSPVRS